MISFKEVENILKNYKDYKKITNLIDQYNDIIEKIYQEHNKIKYKPSFTKLRHPAMQITRNTENNTKSSSTFGNSWRNVSNKKNQKQQQKSNINNNQGIKYIKKKHFVKPTHQLSAILNNTDIILTKFNTYINKLTNHNFDVIYNFVVTQFVEYLSNFIVDYLESYIKFGMSGKCEIEDLNIDLVKEKYEYYQYELYEIILDKYMLGGNNKNIYFNFIKHLESVDTILFNEKIISKIKELFHKNSGIDYDTVNLNNDNDEDDENPLTFFQIDKSPSITNDQKLIYSKITNLITIFEEYDFSLNGIKKINKSLIESIELLLSDTKQFISEIDNKDNDNINIREIQYINNNIKRNESYAEHFGSYYSLYLFNYYNADYNNIINYFIEWNNDLECPDMKPYFNLKSYFFLGLFPVDGIQNIKITNENKEFIKNSFTKLKKSMCRLVKYKILDIIDKL